MNRNVIKVVGCLAVTTLFIFSGLSAASTVSIIRSDEPEIEIVDLNYDGESIIATIKNNAETSKTITVGFSVAYCIGPGITLPKYLGSKETTIQAGETKDVSIECFLRGHFIIYSGVDGDSASKEIWYPLSKIVLFDSPLLERLFSLPIFFRLLNLQ